VSTLRVDARRLLYPVRSCPLCRGVPGLVPGLVGECMAVDSKQDCLRHRTSGTWEGAVSYLYLCTQHAQSQTFRFYNRHRLK
jgi:hypothetical protein